MDNNHILQRNREIANRISGSYNQLEKSETSDFERNSEARTTVSEEDFEIRKSSLETNISSLKEIISQKKEEGVSDDLIKGMENDLGKMKKTLAFTKQYGKFPEGGIGV